MKNISIWILCIIIILHILSSDSRLVFDDDVDDSEFNKSDYDAQDLNNNDELLYEVYKDIFAPLSKKETSPELKKNIEEIFKMPPKLEISEEIFKDIFGPQPTESTLHEFHIDDDVIKDIFGPPPTEKTFTEDRIINVPPSEEAIPSGFKNRKEFYSNIFESLPVNNTFKNDPKVIDNSDKDNAFFEGTSGDFILPSMNIPVDINKTEVVTTTAGPNKDDVDLKIDVKHAPKSLRDAIVYAKAIMITYFDIFKPNATKYVMDNSTSVVNRTAVSDYNAILDSKKNKVEETEVWRDVVIMIAGLFVGSLVLLYVAYRLRECVRRDYYLPDPHFADSTEQM